MKNKEERILLRQALHLAKITKDTVYNDLDMAHVRIDLIIGYLERADKQIRDTIIKRTEQ